MTTAYTSLLGLALPVTGELSGTWGDTVNNSITSLLDTSVAGTTNISADSNVTLTTTTGASNEARQAILLFSGARTAVRTVTAPAQSKIYTVINATTGGYAVTLVGAGPTTGVTIANGARTVVAWNGSDFVEVSSPSSIILPGGTANGVLYLNGSKVVTSGSALTFDGSAMRVSASVAALQIQRTTTTNDATLDFVGAGGGIGAQLRFVASSNDLAFNSAGSEQMRLTSTGLGIGTSSPAAKLEVSGATQATGAVVRLTNSAESSSWAAGNVIGQFDFYSSDSSDPATKSRIASVVESGGTNPTAVGLAFSTYNTSLSEKMRLDSSGNLGLGVTPSAWQSIYRALEIPTGAFFGRNDGGIETGIMANSYRDSAGTRKYRATGVAMRYEQSADGHTFFTAPSGTAGNAITFTQAMTLDASGNLGIGTTSPASKLHVVGNTRITADIESTGNSIIYSSNGSAAGTINAGVYLVGSDSSTRFYTGNSERARIDSSGNLLVGDTTSAYSARLYANGIIAARNGGVDGVFQNAFIAGYNSNYNELNAIQSAVSSGGGLSGWRFQASVGGGSGTTYKTFDSLRDLTIFYTQNTERVRITSAGDLLIGLTSITTATSRSYGNAFSGSSSYANWISWGEGTQTHAVFRNGTNQVGSIVTTSTTTTYNTTSDQRLKENIQDATSASDLIDSLQVRQYDWKADGSHQRYGFIAQELVTVAPEAVHQPTDTDEMMAIDYSKLVPMLVKEVQSLRARVAQLEGN